MSIKIALKNSGSDDMVHAVIRMNQEDYKALRNYMHCEQKDHIMFPYGAYITVRGRGWYRLICTNEKRAVEKVLFAIKCIHRFVAEQDKAVTEQIAVFVPQLLNPGTKLCAYSNFHSQKDLVYLSDRVPTVPNSEPEVRLASQSKLQLLAQKFSR